MGNNTAFEICLDYILNQSTTREIDVFDAAVQKRKKRLSGVSFLNGEETGKQVAENINKTIMTSVSGMTDSIRKFASDLIAKQAPELSKDQAAELLNSWLPEDISFNGVDKPITKSGKINGIPKTVMLEMVHQFVSYGIGEMPDSESKDLKKEMGDWPTKYWEKFPVKIQKEIRNFINGESLSGDFWKSVRNLLS